MVEIIFKREIPEAYAAERDFVESLLKEYGLKIERKLGEDISLEVVIKDYGKTKTNNVDVAIRIICSGKASCSRYFFEANSGDRDLGKAIHNSLTKLNTEIEHKLHLSDQGKR
ncbi:hypothetical protein J4218_03600 [Candidatus Pacearchaeota archaeon]|nr:hypothetical protein [Candidatus Pacearchaeota archaeon]